MFRITLSKLTDLDDFWYMKCRKTTSKAYIFAHLTYYL